MPASGDTDHVVRCGVPNHLAGIAYAPNVHYGTHLGRVQLGVNVVHHFGTIAGDAGLIRPTGKQTWPDRRVPVRGWRVRHEEASLSNGPSKLAASTLPPHTPTDVAIVKERRRQRRGSFPRITFHREIAEDHDMR